MGQEVQFIIKLMYFYLMHSFLVLYNYQMLELFLNGYFNIQKRRKELNQLKLNNNYTSKILILISLYEKPVFDISTAYATILKNMYVVAFYASVIPLALVITCVALLIHYWVEKYNIARRRTIKYNYSS